MWWVIALIVATVWWALDVKFFIDWQTRLATLSANGQYQLIPAECERGLSSFRPMLWVTRKIFFPGLMENNAALQLHMAGHSEPSVALTYVAERAARLPALKAVSLSTRVLALCSAGKMEEARAVFARLKEMQPAQAGLLVSGAVVAASEGRQGEVVEICEQVLAHDPKDEAAHLMKASALMWMGRFDDAHKALEYDPRLLRELMSATDVKRAEQQAPSRELLEQEERARAGVMQPSQLLQTAEIAMTAGAWQDARTFLEWAKPKLGQNPAVNFHFHAFMARCLAQERNAAQALRSLEQADRTAEVLGHNPSMRCEIQLAHARVQHGLGNFTEGLRWCEDVLKGSVTPWHRRQALWWKAQCLDALNRQGEARPLWEELHQARFHDVIERQAEQALARVTTVA